MNANPYPTDLTDAEWDCIKDLIPPPKPGGRHRELDMRAVVNAIFYVVDGGIKWRMLPHEYPNYNSVYWYFAQWRDSGDCSISTIPCAPESASKRGVTSTLRQVALTAKASRPRHWAASAATRAAKRSAIPAEGLSVNGLWAVWPSVVLYGKSARNPIEQESLFMRPCNPTLGVVIPRHEYMASC